MCSEALRGLAHSGECGRFSVGQAAAAVAELADALDLGSSGLTLVEVRVLSAAVSN